QATAGFYSERGIAAVAFGVGGDGQHRPEEYVEISTIMPNFRTLKGVSQTSVTGEAWPAPAGAGGMAEPRMVGRSPSGQCDVDPFGCRLRAACRTAIRAGGRGDIGVVAPG